MGSQHEMNERIEALQGLIERLSASDLTLTEAKDLRGRMIDLLGRDDEPSEWAQVASSPAPVPSHDRGDGPRQNAWSPEPLMRTAG